MIDNEESEVQGLLDIIEDMPTHGKKLLYSFIENIKTVTKLVELLSLSKEEAKKHYKEAIEEGNDILAVIFHYKYIMEYKKEKIEYN